MTTPQNPPQYDPNQPSFGDTYAASQPDFLDNFESLYNAFMVNHIALDSASNAGNHSIVELLEREGAQETEVSEISVYTKNVSGQTDQIFLRYQGNGTEVQLTNYQIYTIPPATGSTPLQFFTFLPGKSILYFGYITVDSSNFGVINLIPPVAVNIVSVALCANNTIANLKPWVSLRGTPQGKINTVILNSRFGLGEKYFYMVWGNI